VYAIAMLVAIAVPTLLTLLFYKRAQVKGELETAHA